MSCENFITCANQDLSLDSLLRMLVVIGDDGELYLKVNNCTGDSPVGTTCGSTGTFTNADLTANRLALNHGCSSVAVGSVMIIDPSGEGESVPFELGDLVGGDTTNNVTVDFGAPIGAGTFRWVVITVI